MCPDHENRKWSTRVATASDVDSLVQLVNSAYRGDSGRKGWTTESDLLGGQRTDREAILETMDRAESRILVAHREMEPEKIFGCVHVEKTSFATEPAAYLGMLTVNVDLQRSGLGNFLVGVAERYAIEKFAATTMIMTVIASRGELIAWYGRRGYERTGERKPFPYGNARFGIPLVQDLYFEVLRKTLKAYKA